MTVMLIAWKKNETGYLLRAYINYNVSKELSFKRPFPVVYTYTTSSSIFTQSIQNNNNSFSLKVICTQQLILFLLSERLYLRI